MRREIRSVVQHEVMNTVDERVAAIMRQKYGSKDTGAPKSGD